MSGHSKWSTIKREKGVKDARRGAVFTKIGNQIAVAARSGTDPALNSALALAIEKARAANMPAANIQRAIDRVADKNQAVMEEATYEAYGPGGIAIIIETATDNKNRTYPDVRTALTKNGGSLAEPGSVMFLFERKGVIRLSQTGEDVLLTVLDAGAEDAVEDDDSLTVYTSPKALAGVRSALVDAGLQVTEASLQYVPKSTVTLDDPIVAQKALKLLDALDDLDDVVDVHTNAEMTAEV